MLMFHVGLLVAALPAWMLVSSLVASLRMSYMWLLVSRSSESSRLGISSVSFVTTACRSSEGNDEVLDKLKRGPRPR